MTRMVIVNATNYSLSSLVSADSFSPASIFWMSLRDCPLVSGTMKKTNMVPKIDKPEKSQKVPP